MNIQNKLFVKRRPFKRRPVGGFIPRGFKPQFANRKPSFKRPKKPRQLPKQKLQRNVDFSNMLKKAVLRNPFAKSKMSVKKKKTKIWDLFVMIMKSAISILALLYSLSFFGVMKATPIAISHIVKGNNGTNFIYYLTTDVWPFTLGQEYKYDYMDNVGNLTKSLKIHISDAYFTFDEVGIGFCGDIEAHINAYCSCWAAGYSTPVPVEDSSCKATRTIVGYGTLKSCAFQPGEYKINYCLHPRPLAMVSRITGIQRLASFVVRDESDNIIYYNQWDTRSMFVFTLRGFTITFVSLMDAGNVDNLLGRYLVRTGTNPNRDSQFPKTVDTTVRVTADMPLLGRGPGLCASAMDMDGNDRIDIEYYSNHSNAGLQGNTWCNPFVKFSTEDPMTEWYYMDTLSQYLPKDAKVLPFGSTNFAVEHGKGEGKHWNEVSLRCVGLSPLGHMFRKAGCAYYLDDNIYGYAASCDMAMNVINSTGSAITVVFYPEGCMLHHGGMTGIQSAGGYANPGSGWAKANYVDVLDEGGFATRMYCAHDNLFQVPLNYTNSIIVPIDGAKVMLTVAGSSTITVSDDGCEPEKIVVTEDKFYYFVLVTGTCSRYTVTTSNPKFAVGVVYNSVARQIVKINHQGTFNVSFTACSATSCSLTFHVFNTGDVEINKYAYTKYNAVLTFLGVTAGNLVGAAWYQRWFTAYIFYFLTWLGLGIASAFLSIVLIYIGICLLYYVVRVYYINKNFGSMDVWVTFVLLLLDLSFMYPIVYFFVYICKSIICKKVAKINFRGNRKRKK